MPTESTEKLDEALEQAILNLNPADDGNWTKDGLPKLQVLTKALGKEVTRLAAESTAKGYDRAEAYEEHGIAKVDTKTDDEEQEEKEQEEKGQEVAEVASLDDAEIALNSAANILKEAQAAFSDAQFNFNKAVSASGSSRYEVSLADANAAYFAKRDKDLERSPIDRGFVGLGESKQVRRPQAAQQVNGEGEKG